jgi:hypothetical protein
MLFLLKVSVTPVLVAAVSLAARWWGPRVGGILMGLPWFTGPVLFILVQEKGVDFGVPACLGILLGVTGVSLFIVTYALLARVTAWPIAIVAAVAAYGAGAWIGQHPQVTAALGQSGTSPLPLAAVVSAVGLAFTYALIPRPRGSQLPQALPWWDIPMRMLATGGLVATLLLAADVLGPRLSGILATYPVILTVVCTFTHHRWGKDAVWRVLLGITTSLYSFIVFFLVVGLTLPPLGLVGAYAAAAAIALAMTAGLLALRRT